MGYYFYFLSENEIVVVRYTEFFKKNIISQKASWRAVDLEEFQDEDASPSENTSNNFVEVESLEPQKDVAHIVGASTPEEVKRMQKVPYASAVGSIIYAIRCTRLDVAFT
nr:zinc finger, CCHC-type [Tanacetum cinerariifolium]